eukprot:gnl/TRDRNA2_/TRDRNA2_206397_c0_seq1.p1 gnl/TRDRNA2_/TRDRNA2_206397_c0~~gnl/TRDRNA2_/TRDRNA2_206397_c0_seq1.p1  ORF type:complete len:338 (-),score=25.37 gnl/TRDRNA2_/TRDRNA2_206397_c0_seq1:13-1026(-)
MCVVNCCQFSWLDLFALRRVLWCSVILLQLRLPCELASVACPSPRGHSDPTWCWCSVAIVLIFEMLLAIALILGFAPGGYLGCCRNGIAHLPIHRSDCAAMVRALVACAIMVLLSAALCSPMPLFILAIIGLVFFGFHVFPKLDSKCYWWSYYATSFTPEEWFSSAEEAVRLTLEHIDQNAPHCLVIGCGTSRLPEQLTTRCAANVVATDISTMILWLRRLWSRSSRIHWEVADATVLPYDNCSFDIVFDKGTIAAISCGAPNGATLCFSEVLRVLRPNGLYASFWISASKMDDLIAASNFEVINVVECCAGAAKAVIARRKSTAQVQVGTIISMAA